MSNRKPISKKIRFEVFKRDSFACQYCGKSAPEVILHVDHIMPVSKGGKNDITNLITACQSCNLGKSNFELDDSSTIEKQKKQLDELQERREQLEMMYDWQRSLLNIDQDATEMVCELFSELVPGHSINDNGKNNIKKLVNRYGFSEVVESLKISVNQYLEYENQKPEQNSVYKTYEYIEKICRNRKRLQDKPYLAELYKIANIIKYKVTYYNHWNVMSILERAHFLGAEIEEMEYIAREVTGWYGWEERMNAYINKLERENGESQNN